MGPVCKIDFLLFCVRDLAKNTDTREHNGSLNAAASHHETSTRISEAGIPLRWHRRLR